MICTVKSASGNLYKLAVLPRTPAREILARAQRLYLEKMTRVVRREMMS